MNMKLEVLIVPVSDVDRAKAFYEKLGFRLDIEIVNENFRAMQFTPPLSEASIILGKGVTSVKPGSADLVLAVDDIDAARADLVARNAPARETRTGQIGTPSTWSPSRPAWNCRNERNWLTVDG